VHPTTGAAQLVEVRERAVRLVQEHRGEYPPPWVAAESIAPKMGCTAYTLLK